MQINGQEVTAEDVTTETEKDHRPSFCFDARQFCGTVIIVMNAPQAELFAQFILNQKSEDVGKSLWAMAEHAKNCATRVRQWIAGTVPAKK